MRQATEVDISSNARVKAYPNCSVLQVANAPIFREQGWEPRKRSYGVAAKGQGTDKAHSQMSSCVRARAAVRDIALCNHFQYFFTLTLDPRQVDRYDPVAVKRKLENSFRNLSRRRGFRYVCIAERHKDGALHFHGLCILGSVRLERAVSPGGRLLSTNRGQPIYNILDWPWGYSTCIQIDDSYERTVNYLLKYITKDGEKIFGKWYFASRDLQKRPEVYLVDGMDFDSFLADNQDAAVVSIYRDIKMGVKQFPGMTEGRVLCGG